MVCSCFFISTPYKRGPQAHLDSTSAMSCLSWLHALIVTCLGESNWWRCRWLLLLLLLLFLLLDLYDSLIQIGSTRRLRLGLSAGLPAMTKHRFIATSLQHSFVVVVFLGFIVTGLFLAIPTMSSSWGNSMIGVSCVGSDIWRGWFVVVKSIVPGRSFPRSKVDCPDQSAPWWWKGKTAPSGKTSLLRCTSPTWPLFERWNLPDAGFKKSFWEHFLVQVVKFGAKLLLKRLELNWISLATLWISWPSLWHVLNFY